ncbi:hypothetical protein [Hasllibacter sp. MH4015]|uniref:hypothetical protein n=1 Tax=Hasllibacter sp. MH4015 TaxID=2854029 RepID=UPI001CD2481A|nr:hypothetical protein [Hasllibacter sp. MH4015]
MRRFSISLCTAVTFGVVSPAQAQVSPEAFVDIMQSCVTWIAGGAVDEFAPPGLDVLLPYPSVNESTGSAVGAFGGMGLSLSVVHGEDGTLCTYSGAGPDPSLAEPVVNAWIAAQVTEGRLVPINDPAVRAPFALCGTLDGTANIFAASGGVNFTMSGGLDALPPGVCE